MRPTPPPVGAPTPVRFPPIVRDALANGLGVWTIAHTTVPTATVAFVVDRGTASDPPGRPGLAGVAADLLDEGAGGRTAIELADAFGALGCELNVDVGPDVTTLSFSSLARVVPGALALMADVVRRPTHDDADFRRVVELRQHSLQQRSRSAVAVADRALAHAVFGTHPYGHGALGTRAALDAMQREEARQFWRESCAPESATLIVSGDVDPMAVMAAARASFGDWTSATYRPADPLPEAVQPVSAVCFVDRPGAAQSELRVGHLGPPRSVPGYHGLLVLDAILGGQFSSRINRNLREKRGLTYGARTSFGFRRHLGGFSCGASVQSDRTAEAAAEVLREFSAIREAPVSADELERAKAALSRGYVRSFETATQYVRAAIQLVTHRLDDDVFNRFVPAIEAVDSDQVYDLARVHIRPREAVVVVVGDRAQCLPSLEALGRPVTVVTPEF